MYDVSRNLLMESVGTYVRRNAKRRLVFDEVAENKDKIDQSGGVRRAVSRGAVGGRKRFKVMKLLKSTINTTNQVLGLRFRYGADPADGNLGFANKHMISEFDPGTSGFIPIFKTSDDAPGAGYLPNQTPMHVYDLNYFVGATEDKKLNWPVTPTSQNEDINARAWYWANDNTFKALRNTSATTGKEPRWFIDHPETLLQDQNPSTRVYRQGIKIKFMLYGCKKMGTRFDVRVIRVTDPVMCPDYAQTLSDNGQHKQLSKFKHCWERLVRPYTINPLLKGDEPQPNVRRWFKTVARKTISIGEQTNDIEQVPCVQSSIYVRVNEAQNYSWSFKEFENETVGDALYDAVPSVETTDIGENNTFQHKPYYTSRYYLVIRAMCPKDGSTKADNQDTSTSDTLTLQGLFDNSRAPTDYIPTYDLMVKTKFKTLNAN